MISTSTALIVFREVLEVAIVLGVVMAATRDLEKRGRWIMSGIGLGLAGSVGLALFANQIGSAFEGVGQEVLNGVILLLACVMIGWTVLWMKQHARELTQALRDVGRSVAEGTLPLYTLTVIVATAVLREGAEIVLFTYSLIASNAAALDEIIMGGLLGLALGALVGWLLYKGLLRISTKHLFSVTSWLLILLAAGMASQSAHYFATADLLPEIYPSVWDSSTLLAEDSPLGRVLHTLIGYSERPSGIQLVFYCTTLVVLGGWLFASSRKQTKKQA